MFSRGIATPSSANDTLNALVEIAKDPAAFQGRRAELKAAEDAANAAIAESTIRRAALNDATNALNTREAGLVKREAKLAKDAATLAQDRTDRKAEAVANAQTAKERSRTLNTIENDLGARAAALEELERASASLNRQAKADRDAAAALRGSLEDIVANLGTLKAQIAALG